MLVTLLAFTPPAAAATPFDARQLAELIRTDNADAAYRLAAEHVAEHEGDPEFDFLYGLAALNSGHLDEGVFALERVLFSHPGDDRARFELARGYFLLGEDSRAREEFGTLLDDDTPADVAAVIGRYLDAIRDRETRYRPALRGHIEVAAGHDSNVNSATQDEFFTSPLLGTLALDPGSREADSAFTALRAGALYHHPADPGFAWFAAGNLDRRWLADHTEFETTLWDARAGINVTREKNGWTVAALYQRFDVDGDLYRELAGVTGEWRHQVDDATRAGIYAQANRLDYRDESVRNSDYYVVGTLAARQFEGRWRPLLEGGLFVGAERARESGANARSIAERDLYGLQAAMLLTLAPDLSAHALLFYQHSRYDAENAFLGVTREDDYYHANAGLTWRLSRSWLLGGELYTTRSDSNSPVNDFSRTQVEVNIRYVFH